MKLTMKLSTKESFSTLEDDVEGNARTVSYKPTATFIENTFFDSRLESPSSHSSFVSEFKNGKKLQSVQSFKIMSFQKFQIYPFCFERSKKLFQSKK